MDFEQLRSALGDVAFTTPTPYTPDSEQVDHEALQENLAALVDAGANIFVPCGNTGEYDNLTHDERIAVVETHVETIGSDGIVVAGLGGSVQTAIDLASTYESLGAEAVMVMHPGHTYMHEGGLIRYYERIADATELGLVLYKRGPELSHRVIAELADRDDVLAVKYAVNDIKAFTQATSDIPEVTWLNGIAERYAPAFAIEGAAGYTTGIGNFVPRATLALRDALDAEAWSRARDLRDLLRPIEDLREEAGEDNTIAAANNVPAVKYGLELAGLNGGPVRDPLVELSPRDQQRLESYYDAVQAATPTP